MTLVVGIESEGRVYMASDSAMTGEYTSLSDRSKIIEKEDMLIGYCGSFRVGQIVEYNLSIIEPVPSEEWLYRDFVWSIQNEISQRGGMADDAELLIGFNGRLYVMQSDYSLLRSARGFAAIGHDGPALGALWATKRIADPIKRLKVAMEAGEAFCPTVSSPFIYRDI